MADGSNTPQASGAPMMPPFDPASVLSAGVSPEAAAGLASLIATATPAPAATPTIRLGVQTSEFWGTKAIQVVTEVIGLSAAVGFHLTPEVQAAVLGLTQTLVVLAEVAYGSGRAKVKSSALGASQP